MKHPDTRLHVSLIPRRHHTRQELYQRNSVEYPTGNPNDGWIATNRPTHLVEHRTWWTWLGRRFRVRIWEVAP